MLVFSHSSVARTIGSPTAPPSPVELDAFGQVVDRTLDEIPEQITILYALLGFTFSAKLHLTPVCPLLLLLVVLVGYRVNKHRILNNCTRQGKCTRKTRVLALE